MAVARAHLKPELLVEGGGAVEVLDGDDEVIDTAGHGYLCGSNDPDSDGWRKIPSIEVRDYGASKAIATPKAALAGTTMRLPISRKGIPSASSRLA